VLLVVASSAPLLYGFGSGFGHGKQKDFVKDYWQQFQAKQTVAGSTTATVR
jgi:hypothetical protein